MLNFALQASKFHTIGSVLRNLLKVQLKARLVIAFVILHLLLKEEKLTLFSTAGQIKQTCIRVAYML